MAVTFGQPRKGALPVTISEATAERLRQRKAARAGQHIGFMDWALKVPEPKAGTLNFDAFPFQRELYLEGAHAKEAVIQKATQVGVSAWGIRWSLYHADTRGRTGLYVFPTKTDMWDFASLRIGPTIEGSEYLRKRRRPDDPDNKGMKGVGLGIVVFRGSESKRGLDSVDCDHIVFDEYDTLDHKNIPDAEMRVSSPLSPGLIRRIGVPSVPDWGIGKLYNESDQRRWMVKCPACSEWQDLDFFENVDLTTALRVCRKCRKSLEAEIVNGEWVAVFPDREIRGYHITRLIAPGANVADVVKKSKLKSPTEQQVFFNKHLGIPHAPAEGRLSKEALAAAQRDYNQASVLAYTGDKHVTMGIDVASVRDLNVRISEHIDADTKRALFIGTVESFNDLGPLMDRYKVNMAAIDHLPDGRLSRAFAEMYPGRVYLVSYDMTPNPKDSNVLKVDDEMRHARVRRVEAIDAMMEAIRGQRNLLPQDLPEGYVEQLQTLVRMVEEDDVGKKTVVYRKLGAADDFAHAEVYDLVANELWWYRQGVDELERDQFRPLDEMLEFERSNLSEYHERGMIPGIDPDVPEDGFNFGPGDEEDDGESDFNFGPGG